MATMMMDSVSAIYTFCQPQIILIFGDGYLLRRLARVVTMSSIVGDLTDLASGSYFLLGLLAVNGLAILYFVKKRGSEPIPSPKVCRSAISISWVLS